MSPVYNVSTIGHPLYTNVAGDVVVVVYLFIVLGSNVFQQQAQGLIK